MQVPISLMILDYNSRELSKPECNYCTTKRELLAVVRAIENFHPYLTLLAPLLPPLWKKVYRKN